MSHALRLRITGLSLLAVLLIAVGGATRGGPPAVHAETTDVVVIGCEFIVSAIDGNATDAINDADVQAACGGLNLAGVPQNLPATGTTGSGSIAHLADVIGNQDGVLTASDFRSDSLDENWDDNQLSTDCHFGGGQSMFDFVAGMSCTLDVFVFVNHEGPVFLDLPAGLKSIESPGTEDFTCINDATIGTGGFSVTGVSTTGVFTTAAAHNLAVGDTINIAAPIDGVPADDYMVATVPSTTTFILSGVTVGPGIPYVAGPIALTNVAVGAPGVWTSAAWPFVVGSQFTLAAPVPGTVPVIPAGTYTISGSMVPTTAFTTGITVTTASTAATTLTPIFTISKLDKSITSDNDCNNGAAPGAGTPNNGDGVVLFHVLEGNSGAGDVKTVTVSQDAVGQVFDVNVVGTRSDVALVLAEDLIETNHAQANVSNCQTTTPYSNGVTPPTSTVARAIVTDADNTILTRVPVFFSITFSTINTTDPARIGLGNSSLGIVSNTFFTVRQKTFGAPTAAYAVICGGTGTGSATIYAAINLISCALTGCTVLGDQLHSTQTLTTGGPPSTVALTPAPPSLVCDGANTSTLTAHVTDWLGHDVADGVPVNFSVIGLGTADPINTVTAGGLASTRIKPLPAASGGVAIVVGAGDSGIAQIAQQSTQVLCTAPPTPTPTPTATPGPGCPGDLDCDGIPDALDNCPSAPNPDQANTNLFNFVLNRPGSDPRGDACDPDISGDGYGNVKKLALSKNLDIYCPIMRADVDGDGAVSILDLAKVALWFTKSIPPAPQRYAQDADAAISILDLTKMAQVFTQHASACP